ncbi:ATP-binding cassette domain-containing protein [Mycoplasmatota bacterium]|nr:ATP-binding cassette domain-containing protein [Mycoplasmatota bacterium]
MLAINNLTIKDCIFDNELIKDLSLSLQKNDKIAIIGSEGTGKSTLLKLLKGDTLNYISYIGEIFINGIVAYTEQNISYLWNEILVYDFLYDEVKDRIEQLDVICRKLLNEFDLEYNDIIHRKINSFSGGEKVKLALVKALIKEPDILLLDEPTNDLDFETIQFLEDFMIHTDIPILFISHDQRLLENVANGIVHLQHIKKQTLAKTYFYRGTYPEYKKKFLNQFDSDLQIARKQRADYKTKMEKFRKVYSKVEYQQNQTVRNPSLARLLKKKIHSLKSQEKRFEKEKDSWMEIPEKEESINIFFSESMKLNHSKRLIEFNVPKFVLPNNQIVKDLELHLNGGEKVVIYGKNGCGKTTFIKKVIEILKSKDINYGYIPQNYMDVLDSNISVVDYIMKNQNRHQEFRIKQILGQLGFKRKEMDETINQLSEGQKLKILLLVLISKDTEILVLDEPTRNISPINLDEVYDLFVQYQGSILAITHDRNFIEAVFDNIYEFSKDGLLLE